METCTGMNKDSTDIPGNTAATNRHRFHPIFSLAVDLTVFPACGVFFLCYLTPAEELLTIVTKALLELGELTTMHRFRF